MGKAQDSTTGTLEKEREANRGGRGWERQRGQKGEPLAALLLEKKGHRRLYPDRCPTLEIESHIAEKRKSTRLTLSQKKAYNLGFTQVGHVCLRLNLYRGPV